MFSRKEENQLPAWLWFFLLLPIVLITLLLYRRERLNALLARRLPASGRLLRRRYVEPDSIPLEMAAEPEPALGLDDEDLALARARGEIPAQADNLEIIEGIGPRIAGLLRDAGITTFRQLAETPSETIVEILTRARLNRLANPGTWAEQSRLAADGKWDELETLQRTLKAGRRVE